MPTGRKFPARFADKASESNFLKWSAAQMTIYNSKVQWHIYSYHLAKMAGCEPDPPDQKYAHLIYEPFTTDLHLEWMEGVPRQVFRIGATMFYRSVKNAMAGLSHRPVEKRIKAADRTLWLVPELYTILPMKGNRFMITFGTQTMYGGRIIVNAHRDWTEPKSIWIKTHGRHLSVSFAQDLPDELPKEKRETKEEMAVRLAMKPREELLAGTKGCDRGVVTPLQTQEEGFRISRVEKTRMRGKRRHQVSLQKKLARQEFGSNGWYKTKLKLNETHRYGTNVRDNFAHQVSHKLVSDPATLLIGFEDLLAEQMARAPKPKFNKNGKAIRNGRAFKKTLNRGIYLSIWGKLLKFTVYKAERAGKLVVTVPPRGTSVTCPVCGTADAKNRPKQALFACVNPECGFNADHSLSADQVAAMNIAARAVEMVLTNKVKTKSKKRTMRMAKKKKAADQPEPASLFDDEITPANVSDSPGEASVEQRKASGE